MKRYAYTTVIVIAAYLCVASVASANSSAPAAYEKDILYRGASLHTANGMHFDNSDRLLVTSLMGNEIVLMDPDNGNILERYDQTMGIEAPDDVSVGKDGSIYWTSPLVGDVGKLTPDKNFVNLGHLGHGVNPITMSDDGRLFVARCISGNELWELDPMGKKEPRRLELDLGPHCGFNAFDFGPDGLLYGPKMYLGKIYKVNVDTLEIEIVREGGNSNAVDINSKGDIYSLYYQTGTVLVTDYKTGETKTVAVLGPGTDNMAFDSKDRLFVSSIYHGYIVEIMPDGKVRTVVPGGLVSSGGLKVTVEGDLEYLLVADLFSLRKIDARSGVEVEAQYPDLVFGGPRFPQTVSGLGEYLLITSWFHRMNHVQVWDFVNKKEIADYTNFKQPINAIEFEGDVVVAEGGTGKLLRFNLKTPEKITEFPVKMQLPAGLLNVSGDLWAVDCAAGVVLKVAEKGKILAKPKKEIEGLSRPEDIAYDNHGNLLVVEVGKSRVIRYSLTTHQTDVIADNLNLGHQSLPDLPVTAFFNGIAVAQSGNIFVTGDKDNVIYRLKPTSK